MTIAAFPALHEAPYFNMNSYAQKYGFRIEVVQLSTAKGTALLRGDVDAALLNFTFMAQFADQGVGTDAVRVVAGGWWGQQWLVVRKGSGITGWSSLRGKTIGAPPGSYAYIAWLNGLNEHRLSNDVKLVNTTFDAATVGRGLRGGSYDGVAFFSPFTDQWVLEGFAEFPTTSFLQDTSLGAAVGLVAIGSKLIKDRDLGLKFVKAVIDMQRDLQQNRSKWAQIVSQVSGTPTDIANFAVQRGCSAFPIEVNALKKFGEIAPQFGVTRRDVSRTITNYVDLSYLREATGLSTRRLISTPACAPEGRASPTGILGTPASEPLRGTAGSDKMFGLGGNDTINGLDGSDVLDGGSGNDRIVAGAGNDQVAGGAGNDVLLGGIGNDRLAGGPGNDIVAGGAGLNQYNGGDGNDTFSTRNGRKETVLCGNGRDRVTADRSDRLRACEIVRRR